DSESDLLGSLQGEGLGDELAQDHVHVSDQGERNGDRDGVGVDSNMGQALDDGQATDETGDHGLANPSQGKANHGDTELDAIDDFVEMLVETLDNAGADTS